MYIIWQRLINWLRRLFRRDKPGYVLNLIVRIDMKTATLNWTLPAVRESGNPLDRADIDRADIYMSADGGANFVLAGTVSESLPQTFTVSDLDVGAYSFRVIVVDTAGREGRAVDVVAEVADETPPGGVTGLEVTLT